MKKHLKKQALSVMIAAAALSGGVAYADSNDQEVKTISAPVVTSGEANSAEAENQLYQVNVEGQSITTAAYVQGEHVMIPLREVSEILGFEVTWNQMNRSAELVLPETPIWTMVQQNVDQYAYNRMNLTLGAAPVNQKGKLFVPASFFSEVLRSQVVITGQQVNITLNSEQEDVEKVNQLGVISAINQDENYKSVQINGVNVNGIVLNIDENTKIANSQGELISFDELTLGMTIEVKHSLAMTMSLPGQTYAYEITVLDAANEPEMLGTAGTIEEVRNDEGKVSIIVSGAAMSSVSQERIVLNLDEQTTIVDLEGNAVALEKLEKGANVLSYYGPRLAKSLPPIGHAWKIVYLGQE